LLHRAAGDHKSLGNQIELDLSSLLLAAKVGDAFRGLQAATQCVANGQGRDQAFGRHGVETRHRALALAGGALGQRHDRLDDAELAAQLAFADGKLAIAVGHIGQLLDHFEGFEAQQRRTHLDRVALLDEDFHDLGRVAGVDRVTVLEHDAIGREHDGVAREIIDDRSGEGRYERQIDHASPTHRTGALLFAEGVNAVMLA
jgi:hypothetical protein